MAKKTTSMGRVLVLLVIVAVIWLKQSDFLNQGGLNPASGKPALPESGGYAWVEHRHNDGDSFHVRTPEGEEQEIRLYFVDAPESALKRYGNGETNHERVDDQGRDLGLDRDRTVEVGQQAKAWVKETLRGREFTVYTQGEKVYGGPRIYGFVRVEEGGEERWLHELLVERGLVRIHTKGASLPDGTSRSKQERRLKSLERDAKRRKAGAWGMP